MAKGYINWKLAIVLVVATGVCVGAGLVLHDWQKNTRAQQARPLGLKAYDQENWSEAADQLGRYLAVNGGDVDILMKYGHAQRQIRPLRPNNVDQAINAYSSILRSEKATAEDTHEATRWLVELCSALPQRFPEAESRAGKYLESKDDPVLRRLLGLTLARQGKYQEAFATLRSLVEDHPQEVRAYILLGTLVEMRPTDFNEPAQYWYDKMIAANPDSALAHIRYGRSLLKQKDDPNCVEKAAEEYARAGNLNLSDTEVQLELISALISIGEFDKAREYVQAAIAQTPKESGLWSSWAKIAIRSQSTDEMKQVAEAGLKALPNQPWEFMLWGTELFIRTEQFEKAKECILKLQKVDYQSYRPRIHFLEGLLAERQGQLREAADAWEKAIALKYQSESDMRWRGEPPMIRMALTEVLLRLGNTSQAIAQLRAQVSEIPDYDQAHLVLARLLVQERDWAEVLKHAREVLRLSPGNADAIQLELNARSLLQGNAAPTAADEQAWKDIEKQIAHLSEGAEDSLRTAILKAQVAIARERSDEVTAILEELDRDHPDILAPVLLRVKWYVTEDKTDEAVTLLDRAIERFPQDSTPVIKLLELLYGQDDLSRCESVLKAAIERIEAVEDRKRLGQQLVELYRAWGRDDQRYEWSKTLAEQFPDEIAFKQDLLAVDRVIRDTERAQKIVDEIKAIEGQGGRQWRIEQVRLWMASSDFLSHYTEAIRLLQENLLSDPDDQISRRYLAGAYGRKGEYQLALMIWQEALARSSASDLDYGQTVAGTVDALYKVGQTDEARRLLGRAEKEGAKIPGLDVLKVQGYLSSQEWNAASDLLLQMVHQEPNDFWANSQLVRAYRVQKMSDEALKVCDAFVENQGTAVAYLLRAQTYEALGRFDEALADYDRAVALSPELPGSWMARAEFRLRQNEIGPGIPDIQKALALAPDLPEIQITAAKLFLASDNAELIEQGRGLLDHAIAAGNQDTDLRILEAKVLMDEGAASSIEKARTLLEGLTREVASPLEAWRLLVILERSYSGSDKAIEVATRGLARYPDNPILLLLKVLAEAKNDPAAAIPTLNSLLEKYPNDISIVKDLAILYVRTEQYQNALKLLQERVPTLTGPARRSGELMLAEVLYNSGAVSQASAAYERLIESDPNDSGPVLSWAGWLTYGKQHAQAADLAERWRAKHPDDPNVPTMIAGGLFATGAPEALQKAQELTERTLAAHPTYVNALRLLANIKLQSGRPGDLEESAALDRRILQVDPDNVIAMNNLAWYLCETRGEYQAALDLAKKGVDIAPKFADILDTRGVIHYRMRNFAAAERDLVRCLGLYSPNAVALPTTRLHLARVYTELGRKTEAIQQLSQALDAQNKARKAGSPAVPPLSDADETEAQQLQERLRKGS